MARKNKNRRFEIKDKRNEDDEKRIKFRRLTHKRPTKNIWVLLLLFGLAVALFLYLTNIG